MINQTQSDVLVTDPKPTNVRWRLLSVVFIAALVAFFDRVNLSVAAPYVMKEYGFSSVQYGMTVSVFMLAYMIAQIPSGYLSDKFGIRKMGFVALFGWSLFTVLTPMAAGFTSFLIIRFLFGFGEGPMFPNNGNFLKRFFNKTEKATSSGLMLTGSFIAPAFATPISVWLMELFGWRALFYIYGMVGVIVACTWYICFRETPSTHPWMNKAEVELIGSTEENSPPAPWSLWKSFLKSPQFWAHGIQYTFVNYIFYIFMTWLPIYLLQTRGMSLKSMGFGAGLPYIFLCLGMVISGRISDGLIKRGKSKFVSRTICMVVGMMACGIGLYMGANAATAYGAVAWMSASLGFLGLNYTCSWAVCQDLGNKRSVQVTTWMQTWAAFGMFLSPTLTAVFATTFGWTMALNISAGLVFVGAIVCLFIRPDHPLHD